MSLYITADQGFCPFQGQESFDVSNDTAGPGGGCIGLFGRVKKGLGEFPGTDVFLVSFKHISMFSRAERLNRTN